jgi:hypothetical protein
VLLRPRRPQLTQAAADPFLGWTAAYADQNERDYRLLLEAISAGRVLAQEGR